MADQRTEPSSSRQVLLVLGMHRSGTSAAAGVIGRLGAILPKTLMSAGPQNPKGFAESAALAQYHDRLLKSAGSNWRDWTPFDPEWHRSAAADAFTAKFPELIHSEFGQAPMFVVKDPRICRLLPFWLEQLEILEVSSKAILVVRNPLEIAASLNRRNGFSPRVCFLLWLRHVLDAEVASRSLPRVWLHYDELLGDWRGVAGRIGSKLEIDWPNPIDEAAPELDSFLSRELQHHESSLAELLDRADAFDWLKRAYAALSDREALQAEDPALLAVLDEVRMSFDRACEIYLPLRKQGFPRSAEHLDRLAGEMDFSKHPRHRRLHYLDVERLKGTAARLKRLPASLVRRSRAALGGKP